MTRSGTIILPAAEVKIPLAGLELTLSTVLWAAVGVIVTLIAGRTAYRLVLRIGHNVEGIADDLALQAARVARYLVYILGAGVVLAILGAPIQPVLAATLLVLAVVYLLVRIKRSDLPDGPVHDQLAGVSDTILAQLRSVRGVLDSPAPSIRLTSTDHQELAVRVRVWHRPDAHSRVSSEAADTIATAFEHRSQTVAVSWPPDSTTIAIAGEL